MDTVFIWIGRLTALIGLLALVRMLVCMKYSKPKITFGEPRYVENTFGRTWSVSISNERLAGLASKICKRKDIPKCRVRGEFSFDGETRTHEWGNDPATPIQLPANSEPYDLELINKKQGYPECVIEVVPVNEYQRLPGNKTIEITLSILEGDRLILTAKYRARKLWHQHE